MNSEGLLHIVRQPFLLYKFISNGVQGATSGIKKQVV